MLNEAILVLLRHKALCIQPSRSKRLDCPDTGPIPEIEWRGIDFPQADLLMMRRL